ncbi:MAG: hypothetical protein MZU97_08725 [Bacillus subtilis]|nr:hypothetical protein [Bacillus subtilis]
MEVDLIVPAKGNSMPSEIKLTSTPTARHIDPLTRFRKLARGDAADTDFSCAGLRRRRPLLSTIRHFPGMSFRDGFFPDSGVRGRRELTRPGFAGLSGLVTLQIAVARKANALGKDLFPMLDYTKDRTEAENSDK